MCSDWTLTVARPLPGCPGQPSLPTAPQGFGARCSQPDPSSRTVPVPTALRDPGAACAHPYTLPGCRDRRLAATPGTQPLHLFWIRLTFMSANSK